MSSPVQAASIATALRLVTEFLDSVGVRAALIGGLAIRRWTRARTTKDVDLAVAAQDLQQIRDATDGQGRSGDGIYSLKLDGVHIDFLDPQRFPWTEDAIRTSVPDPVLGLGLVRPEYLVCYKLHPWAGREKDEDDVRLLLRMGDDVYRDARRLVRRWLPNRLDDLEQFREEAQLTAVAQVRAAGPDDGYRGEHGAPSNDGVSKPIHDLTGVYPDDIYSPDGLRMYGAGQDGAAEAWHILCSVRGRPNRMVRIYRAAPKIQTAAEQIDDLEQQKRYMLKTGKIPSNARPPLYRQGMNKGAYYDAVYDEIERLQAAPPSPSGKATINPGDWVLLSRAYAKEHGISALNGQYSIISKTVPARHVYTNGDSLQEFGYDPGGAVVSAVTAAGPAATVAARVQAHFFRRSELTDGMTTERRAAALADARRAQAAGPVEALQRAIHQNEIPPQYRSLPVLGRGNTAIILAKDQDTALIFTRDAMKAEWLCQSWGLGLGRHVEEFQGHRHPDPKARALDIQVIEMPRLEKLSGENATKVRRSIREFEQHLQTARKAGSDEFGTRKRGGSGRTDKKALLQQLMRIYNEEDRPDDPITQYLDFISNYSDDNINFDIALRNFMQTRDGQIVLLDPAVSRDVLDILFPKPTARW